MKYVRKISLASFLLLGISSILIPMGGEGTGTGKFGSSDFGGEIKGIDFAGGNCTRPLGGKGTEIIQLAGGETKGAGGSRNGKFRNSEIVFLMDIQKA